jgi:hypothetical protein
MNIYTSVRVYVNIKKHKILFSVELKRKKSEKNNVI